MGAATPEELELWRQTWRRPQAIMWETNGQHLEIAFFVRSFIEGTRSDAVSALRTLVRQQMDSLGMSVPGLRANRWRIVDDEQEHGSGFRPATRSSTAQPSAKERLKVVPGGAS